MRLIITCTLALLIVFVSLGKSNSADSLQVYFTINGAQYDPVLGDNASSMDNFVGNMLHALQSADAGHVEVVGYTSPSGSLNENELLAALRAENVAVELAARSGLPREKFAVRSGGVAWDELRRRVAADSEVPSREQLLVILGDESLEVYDVLGKLVDERKVNIKAINSCRTYDWLQTHVFPSLDKAVVKVVDGDLAAADDTSEALVISELQTAPGLFETAKAGKPFHLLALKTNVIFAAALMPNLELEWMFKRNWSWLMEGNLAWWGHYKNQRSLRIAIIDTEVRRWFKTPEPWHGIYVGLFAGGGWYDILKDRPGYYGEGLMAGLSFGYMWPVSRNLSLEAGIGAGYMRTRYKEYEPVDGHHVYQRTKNLNYYGPLKLKFSIVWRFLDKNKIGVKPVI